MALFKKNKEETPKKNKEKHIFKKPVESTQQNVPIRDIYKGVFIFQKTVNCKRIY